MRISDWSSDVCSSDLVTLVAWAGVEELQSALSDEARLDLESSVTTCLRASSLGGDSVTRIGEGRFGLIHAAGTDMGRVLEQVEDVTRRVDPAGQGAKVESATIKPGEAAGDVNEIGRASCRERGCQYV